MILPFHKPVLSASGLLIVFCLGVFGCGTREPPSEKDPAHAADIIFKLQLQRQFPRDSDAKRVEFVEELQNISSQRICFAVRSCERHLVQVAEFRMVKGQHKVMYHAEPRDLSLDGRDSESQQQIVEDFVASERGYDGGEWLEPLRKQVGPQEKFSVLQDGLYRLRSTWVVEILDGEKAPHRKVLKTCTIESNTLDLDIRNSLQERKRGKENGDITD